MAFGFGAEACARLAELLASFVQFNLLTCEYSAYMCRMRAGMCEHVCVCGCEIRWVDRRKPLQPKCSLK